jgi:hypothetical protein
MIIGMLWNGVNAHAAKEYFIKKYGRIPDTVEMSPTFAKKFEIKNGMLEGLKISFCNEIQNGNLLIGLEKDKDNSQYLKVKEEK